MKHILKILIICFAISNPFLLNGALKLQIEGDGVKIGSMVFRTAKNDPIAPKTYMALIAIATNQLDRFQHLLKKNPELIEKKLQYDLTFFHVAAEQLNPKALETLVKQKGNINHKSKYGLTPLDHLTEWEKKIKNNKGKSNQAKLIEILEQQLSKSLSILKKAGAKPSNSITKISGIFDEKYGHLLKNK